MNKPNDWVRVRDDRTGHHITVTARHAAMNKHFRILGGSDAVDVNGRPLPAKALRHDPTNEPTKPEA